VTPRGTARTLTVVAVLSALTGIAAIPWGPLAVVLGLATTVICVGLAAGYRQRHHEAAAAERQARPVIPDPKPMTDPQRWHGPPLTPAEAQAWKTITDHLKQEQP